MNGSRILAAGRLLTYFLFTCALIPLQAAALLARSRLAERIPPAYHRICCRIIGLDMAVRGTVSADRPTLFVSNHSSYLDIIVLGALIHGSFVAKSEVAGWPFFGLLARLQRTVFVDRLARNAVAHGGRLRTRLEAGDSLILFPEGTSSDGNRTLPFKSALFAAAGITVAGRQITVQPVSVTCTALDGIPLGRRFRPIYAWYGDMDLLPHLWSLVGLGRLKVDIDFHAPTTLSEAGSRKALAARCWEVVAAAVDEANAGRAATESAPAVAAPAGIAALPDMNP